MSEGSGRFPTTLAVAGPHRGRQELARRLGINVPAGWWPTAPTLKGMEAAGFAWVQVHAPPRGVLCEPEQTEAHALALRAALDAGGLRLILHGPDDLCAGDPDHVPALDGLIAYAAATGAEYVVYHGANLPVADGGAAASHVQESLQREERALRERAGRIAAAGFTLAIENLAPVWPGPPRLCHSPRFVHDLVRRLDAPRIGMLLDLGHAHIVAGLTGGNLHAMAASVADEVVLFLARHGYTEEVLAAALLHDVVEDTSLRLEDLAQRFGARVAGLVAMMTEDATIEPYEARKANHRERLTAADSSAAAIFAADKLAKLRDLAAHSSPVEPAKLDHYRRSLEMLRSAHPEVPFLGELDRQLSAYRETVGAGQTASV